MFNYVSEEARSVLAEIIENESTPDYWKERFDNLSNKDDIILRGCFKELSDANLISTKWADNYPYIIFVLKDGYFYEKQLKTENERRISMTQFEKELNELLERAKTITPPTNVAAIGTNLAERNKDSNIWINDFEIFYDKYLKEHALSSRIKTILFHRTNDAYSELVSCLISISKDQDYIDRVNGIVRKTVPAYKAKNIPEYDVFLSHANADKSTIVDDLNESLEKLGISIFYDKKSLEWGDKWKERILDGTAKAEFAIIVISENFFGREWTEKELSEFLNRQNRDGQKLILPIVHNISNDDLRREYPNIADIQAIDSKDYTCDQIALLFAKQLIKRLKTE